MERLTPSRISGHIAQGPQRAAAAGENRAAHDHHAPATNAVEAAAESAFMACVGSFLEGDSGVLRFSNRCKLLDLAARLGLSRFEANLLIERARFQADRARPDAMMPWRDDATGSSSPGVALIDRRRTRRLVRWLAVIAIALLLDAILVGLVLLR